MSNNQNFGPLPDQRERVKLLPWPMFFELVELVELDPGYFSRMMPPASLALDFRTQAKAAQITPFAIEVALHWITRAQRPHLRKALTLLDFEDPTRNEGTPSWVTNIAAAAEVRSMTLASLKAALNEAKGDRLGAALDADNDWKGTDTRGLEKLMGDESTLLPIFFLNLALRRASAVAKIETPAGVGTGFVIAGNLLVTNAHVLPDLATAMASTAVFNYQKSADSLDLNPIPIKLAPDQKFLLSPATERDLAVVALAEPARERWTEIALALQKVKANERACIIQHPGGDQKHIGLYHNTVTFADDNIVQYLTDTLPGSSGAPVFNQYWELIAIHHAGGWLREPGQKTKLFRNEGIAVTQLINLIS